MAPQIDTAQRRAEAVAIELLERMGLRGHPAASQFVGDILEHDKQTRRAALLEARKAVVSEYLQDPVEDDPGDIAYDHAIRDAVEAIDRLAQEAQGGVEE